MSANKLLDCETDQQKELSDFYNECTKEFRGLSIFLCRSVADGDDVLREAIGEVVVIILKNHQQSVSHERWKREVRNRINWRAKDLYRKKTLEKIYLQNRCGLKSSGSHESDPIREVEEKDAIAFAMSQLSNSEQDLLSWRFWDGLTTEQICDKLDITQKAVRTRFSRTYERLRDIIMSGLQDKSPENENE